MSTLIFCKNQVAARPFYIEDVSLNVYSIEELSYYMLNNVYLLSDKFMSVELCNWIGRELKMTELSAKLLELIKSNAPLHIFAYHILSSNGYSSKKEIKDALEVISTFENKSEAECRKLRADRLMNNSKLVDAIYEYEAILSDDVAKTLSKAVEGDVYHNLGCAFSKLFFFEEAAKCFEEAYKRNTKQASLNCLLYALRCKKDKAGFDEMVSKYQVSNEMAENILSRVSAATKDEKILEFDTAINDLQKETEGLEKFYDSVKMISNGWQENYTKLCRI